MTVRGERSGEIDEMIDRFMAVRLGDSDALLLQVGVGRVLLDAPVRFELTNGAQDPDEEYLEVGVVIRGNSEITGNAEDEGVLMVVQLGGRPREARPNRRSSDADLTIDQGNSRLDRLLVELAKSGKRTVMFQMFGEPDDKGRYQTNHDRIIAGELDGPNIASSHGDPQELLGLRKAQAARLLGQGAIEMIETTLTRRFNDPVHSANRPQQPLYPLNAQIL